MIVMMMVCCAQVDGSRWSHRPWRLLPAMSSRSPSRPRPLSSVPPTRTLLRRKYSLDHDHGQQQDDSRWEPLPPTPLQSSSQNPPAEVTSSEQGEEVPPSERGTDVNHNEREETKTCARKLLKKQTSFESIGCDDNYLYDFFDRNYRPPTPAPAQGSSGESRQPAVEESLGENNNVVNTGGGVEVNNNDCASRRRNVNSVRRPKSWLMTSTVEERVKRRQTDPCGRDFLSNYERALSSLLYQPYDCRTEGPSSSTTTTFDDSDVSYWLGPDRERESSDTSSRSSLSSSSSSVGSKPWGDSKDPSSSSIRALLRGGNTGERESSDLDCELSAGPLGALVEASAQSTAGHGREMLVRVSEPEVEEVTVSSATCYRAVPATVSAVPVIACSNVSNVRIVQSARTFTSTEAQTDDVVVTPSREQRRRDRRERRHQRRLLHPQTTEHALWHPPLNEPLVDRLPDILNSHLPPPYTTLPVGLAPHPPPPLPPPNTVVALPVSPPTQATGFRFPFAIVPAGRRR